MINNRIKLKYNKLHPKGWRNGYLKPAGKFWKRISSRKVRRSKITLNGAFYKKLFAPFEWC